MFKVNKKERHKIRKEKPHYLNIYTVSVLAKINQDTAIYYGIMCHSNKNFKYFFLNKMKKYSVFQELLFFKNFPNRLVQIIDIKM